MERLFPIVFMKRFASFERACLTSDNRLVSFLARHSCLNSRSVFRCNAIHVRTYLNISLNEWENYCDVHRDTNVILCDLIDMRDGLKSCEIIEYRELESLIFMWTRSDVMQLDM